MTNEALTFDDLGFPLAQATFVVIDLETTGTNSGENGITEIGAVMVRGGQVIGEFQTFVNPGVPIPAFISVLTGITDAHVASAPRIEVALPMLLEFAGFAGRSTSLPIMVAHNAAFDAGFLKSACLYTQTEWPDPIVLDTVRLARRILRNGEVINHKLSTLAAYFGADTTPNHRALDDARATVDVLHGLISRVGNLGVTEVESLMAFDGAATESRRRKRHLADGAPALPGVYIFNDVKNRPLYIGVSSNMRNRVRSYFTAAETRRRMTTMVELAESVITIPCATSLEAKVRELRLIHEHRPRFNVRSTKPERTTWVALTRDKYPRLSIVRQSNLRDESRAILGPFAGARRAQLAIDALHDCYAIRQCTQRITSARPGTSCVLLDLGRCSAPCVNDEVQDEYAAHISAATKAMTSDVHEVSREMNERMSAYSRDERFEEAASTRDSLDAYLHGAYRTASLRALSSIPLLVAASPNTIEGWDIHVITHGWLASCAHARTADSVVQVADAAISTAASLPDEGALVSETLLLINWLEQPNTRLIQISNNHGWHMPRHIYAPTSANR